MEKKKLADRIAEKAFHSAKVQESWKVHMQVFGPILEPAFVDDYKTRIDLIAALNRLSRRDVKGGMDKLMSLKSACKCDADRAAWHFFFGLGFELAGATKEMVQMYQQAGQYGHHFYLPYLKVAKSAHNDGCFEIAEENYLDAIRCLEEDKLDQLTTTVLASAYANYASSLTMMHRFEEAELALKKSIAFLPNLPNRSATQAILYAAMGECDKSAQYLSDLEKQGSVIVGETKKLTEEILNDKHPHFSAIPLTEEQISAFWIWFVAHEIVLADKFKNGTYEEAFTLLQMQLKSLFPYLERDPDCAYELRDDRICITLADYFMVSLDKSYQQLLAACPEELKSRWCFEIVH